MYVKALCSIDRNDRLTICSHENINCNSNTVIYIITIAIYIITIAIPNNSYIEIIRDYITI